jgi:hypothetical protein
LVFKCSGLYTLPITSISSLGAPLAFEQSMNVIWSLDILSPSALLQLGG